MNYFPKVNINKKVVYFNGVQIELLLFYPNLLNKR